MIESRTAVGTLMPIDINLQRQKNEAQASGYVSHDFVVENVKVKACIDVAKMKHRF